MTSLRRYEILLPLLFNNGTPVPETLLFQTFSELRGRFGAASWETQTLRGAWTYQGVAYQDNLTRLFVDVADTPEHRRFFVDYKNTLKNRFKQIDIWITSYPLDVI